MGFTWKIYHPSETFGPVPGILPDWLLEIRALRTLEIERGLAANVHTSVGRSDADPLDHHSYHVVAYLDGKAIGCIRLSADLTEASVRDFFGGMGFTGMNGWSSEIWTTAVSSRWVVAMEHRSLSLAQQLVACTYALGGHLGILSVHAAVGTRFGQDKILMRSGAEPAMHFGGLVPVPRFNDHVYIMKFDVSRPRAGFVSLIEAMRVCLAIEFLLLDARTAARTENSTERIAA